jgi:hypothetical protein
MVSGQVRVRVGVRFSRIPTSSEVRPDAGADKETTHGPTSHIPTSSEVGLECAHFLRQRVKLQFF